jgi:hypothetical protein
MLEVLHRLRYAVWHKWPVSWKQGDWQLHNDNAPSTHPTLSRTSWLNIRSHKCRNPTTQRRWPGVTFFYSQRWKCCWRRIGFETQRRQNEMRQSSCWLFQRVSSKSASDNGRTAGTSVWCLKGPTLKGIRTATPWVSQSVFPDPWLDTFWSGHVDKCSWKQCYVTVICKTWFLHYGFQNQT